MGGEPGEKGSKESLHPMTAPRADVEGKRLGVSRSEAKLCARTCGCSGTHFRFYGGRAATGEGTETWNGHAGFLEVEGKGMVLCGTMSFNEKVDC